MDAGYKYHHRTREACVCGVLILTITLLYTPLSVSRTERASKFQVGVEYVRLRLYPQAADTFKSILLQHPTDVNALFQLANLYRLQDELEVAIETFNKILTIADPEDSPTNSRRYGLIHLALSEIYCEQSQLDLAEHHAKEAVQRCPTDANTHYRLGYIYTHQAKFDAALAAFKQTKLQDQHQRLQ